MDPQYIAHLSLQPNDPRAKCGFLCRNQQQHCRNYISLDAWPKTLAPVFCSKHCFSVASEFSASASSPPPLKKNQKNKNPSKAA